MRPELSAPRDYRALMAEVTELADGLREQDRRRAEELERRLLGLDDMMLSTGQRSRVSEAVVRMVWEDAVDRLWPEDWMQLRPQPVPDQGVDPAELARLDDELQHRAAELREATTLRWYHLGRR